MLYVLYMMRGNRRLAELILGGYIVISTNLNKTGYAKTFAGIGEFVFINRYERANHIADFILGR